MNQFQELSQTNSINYNNTLVQKIIGILKTHLDGVTIHDLIKIIEDEDGDTKQMNEAIKYLEKNRFISIQTSGDLQIFKYQDPNDLRHLMDQKSRLSQDEYKVYECIYNSKKRGVEKKEIENTTQIFRSIVTKVLKDLEKQNLIKGIKGLKSRSKQKVYYQFNIDIDDDQEGGSIFLRDGKVDEKIVGKFSQQIIQELQNNKRISLDKLTSTLRVIDTNLDTVAVQKLLNLLIFDDIVEEIKSDLGSLGGASQYQLCNWSNIKNKNIEFPPISKTPCGHCEVRTECRPGGVISPENCIYFDQFADW